MQINVLCRRVVCFVKFENIPSDCYKSYDTNNLHSHATISILVSSTSAQPSTAQSTAATSQTTPTSTSTVACAEDEETILDSPNPIVSVSPDDDGIYEETGVVTDEPIIITTPVRESLVPVSYDVMHG